LLWFFFLISFSFFSLHPPAKALSARFFPAGSAGFKEKAPHGANYILKGRMNMLLSARNQFAGTVTKVTDGAVNGIVTIDVNGTPVGVD
jgi:molybdate transport system regulatory protein